ncbi:DUF2309 domain-containing protein [Halogeometricum limi]|uniref:Probable inorganic carbon transporter subunit DabA n=1 Tax=Halogeometricum limi TaxID=555875 RepID=A0A1I6GT45_9EURY|nr:DUF2309 domain-containing protein [Halogeometricum limi]SFR45404.1 hypothetical protein SAMN04488124_1502 [Halogeometricum limi]
MSNERAVSEAIQQASNSVGSVWPLHSFVTANPLAGFEDRPFEEAVAHGSRLFGGDGYPSAAVFRRALEAGQIDRELLTSELANHGYDADPEALLTRMESAATPADGEGTATPDVDQVLAKWLAGFLDHGRAKWSMPNRERGFYGCFRAMAQYDRDIPDREALATLPEDPVEAIERYVDGHPTDRLAELFEYHLVALPGWTGFLKQRIDDGGEWQSAHPISLEGYLAVRLALADRFGAPVAPPPEFAADADGRDDDANSLPEVWLTAWEATYRRELVTAVADASQTLDDAKDDERPAAQLVFCIDTRSEVIRRHLESTGAYETHGYAGFFGVPMRFEGYDSDVSVDACPPIVDARHHVTDRPTGDDREFRERHDRWSRARDAWEDVVGSLKSNVSTAFSFVESTGVAYGAALTVRTLLPNLVYDTHDAARKRSPSAHEFCAPDIHRDAADGDGLPSGMTTGEQIEYAADAFESMGWTQFGRLVAFVGHAGQTANNPFSSSLDCGACAGNPGGPSARVLAAICNEPAVKEGLRDRGIDVPEDTVFVAGEHNTTTDEVTLYAGDVPASHDEDVEQLRSDLETARRAAAEERVDTTDSDASGVREAERRAADWAETRPEWGLAGNASFVVGPRDLTEGIDLGGRSFLHSYDWRTDPDGEALAAIVGGPMVVTQWINSQYYFATVDNDVYGSGSKVTHNPVGNVGVYQGNGGDLMTGLPLQSVLADDDVPYHQPLRLSTVIHAPVDRVTDVLSDNDHVTDLLDNGWLSLTVVDPTRDHEAFRYVAGLDWRPADATQRTLTEDSHPVALSVAED